MKYFTMDWWLAFQNPDMPEKDAARPQQEYERHYKSIKKHLPKRFLTFDKSYSLHDATLLKLSLNADKEQIKIKFMLAVVHKKFIEGRNGTLIYSGVTDFTSSKRAEVSLVDSTYNYGHLGYDEIEMISPGVFEHRMLFSSGAEFGIVGSPPHVWRIVRDPRPAETPVRFTSTRVENRRC